MVRPAQVFNEWLGLVSSRSVLGKQAHDARLAAMCKTHGAALLTFNTPDLVRYGIRAISPADVLAEN
jgi:hypothetical protein